MDSIDLGTMTDLDIFRSFVPDGKEEEALTGSYSELVSLIGREATLKLYRYFRGCKIDCPKFFYRQDFIVALAAKEPNKREESARRGTRENRCGERVYRQPAGGFSQFVEKG